MELGTLLEFLHTAGRLKDRTRHSWSPEGRRESVAEHCWRLSLMALLLGDEIAGIDRERLMALCIVHDLGEAVTGDVPAFEKTDAHEEDERAAVLLLCERLGGQSGAELQALFAELWEKKTSESRLFDALDRLEAVISHNEADLSTWLPLEYELNPVYGQEACAAFEITRALRAVQKQISLDKIAAQSCNDGENMV